MPRLTLFSLLLLGLTVQTAHAQVSMFADPKANRVGDIITVVLEERTAAQRESAWKNASDASTGARGDVSAGQMAGAFAIDAQFDTDAAARNESVQSDLLKGTVSALVTGVDEAGNLVIQGDRTLNVNGETHLMHISGIVRPYDLSYDNSVVSHRIANASITYKREGGGPISTFRKPGGFAKIGAIAALLAAAFFAL